MIASEKFFNRYTPRVAQDLLGCFLIRKQGKVVYRGLITETEAYRGRHDHGSHAWRGETDRNFIMFGSAGHIYVYLVYGMHWMLNFVTEEKGYPAAVLIRGVNLIGVEGEIIGRFNGPGKLTKAMHISGKENGIIANKKGHLWIEMPKKNRRKIVASPRIGIDYAGHSKNWKWNFKLVQ